MPASASGSESATVPRTSELGAGDGAPSTGAARSRRRRPGAEDGVGARRAHVERLCDEPVAHALRDAPGAAVGGDLGPQQRGGAADVGRGARRAAAGGERLGLGIARA